MRVVFVEWMLGKHSWDDIWTTVVREYANIHACSACASNSHVDCTFLTKSQVLYYLVPIVSIVGTQYEFSAYLI